MLISEGIKIEKEADLSFPLPGQDFVLSRHYSGSGVTTDDSVQFPWTLGRGWASSAEGYIGFHPQRISNIFPSALPDHVEVVAFPLEHSSQYMNEIDANGFVDRTRDNLFLAIGPSDTRVIKTAGRLLGYPGSTTDYSVWVHETSGEGETIYFRVDDISSPIRYLDGRIAQRRDAFGNRWTYTYVQHTLPGGAIEGRLTRIYLNGNSEATASAVVDFSWPTGSGTVDRVHRVEIKVPFVSGSSTTFITTQYVDYTYKGDDQQFSADLAPAADYLVLVEQGMLLNGPPVGTAPATGWTPIYSLRFTHYRYSAQKLLTHTFLPEQIEYYAQHVASGTDLRVIARDLLTKSTDATVGSTTLAALASKIVTYFPDSTDDQNSDPNNPGYVPKALAGMVKEELLQHGCSCSGGQTMKNTFSYGRTWVWDAKEVFPSGSSSYTVYPGHWKTVTETTEWTRTSSTWSRDKIFRSWSDFRPVYHKRVAYTDGSLTMRFAVWINVPFVVADEIEEPEENVQGGQTARHWHSLHEFDLHQQRKTRFHESAVDHFAKDSHGCLSYPDPGPDPPATTPTPMDAVVLRSGGLITWTDYDDLGRKTATGVARSSPSNPAGTDRTSTTEWEYLHNTRPDAQDHTRTDLVKKKSELAGSGFPQSVPDLLESYDYIEDRVSVGGLLDTLQTRDRVRLVKVSHPRESTAENGPGTGDLSAWKVYDPSGNLLFSSDPFGTISKFEYDSATGSLRRTTSNVARAEMAQAVSDLGLALPSSVGSKSSDGQLTSQRLNNLVGWPLKIIRADGVTSGYLYNYEQVPQASGSSGANGDPGYAAPKLKFLTQTTLPHRLSDGSHNGPALKEWTDADLNVLRASSYQLAPGSVSEATGPGGITYPASLTLDSTTTERRRSIHRYNLGGMVIESRYWNDLAFDRSDAELFEYDPRGRLSKHTAPDGEVTITDYDLFDRAVRGRRGSDAQHLQTVEESFYDFVSDSSSDEPRQGDHGDGKLTVHRQWAAGDQKRDTVTVHDWRGRARLSYSRDPQHNWSYPDKGTITATLQDNLNRTLETLTVQGGASLSSLIAAMRSDAHGSLEVVSTPVKLGFSRQFYSVRGLRYRSEERLDPLDTGSGFLRSDFFFDENGREIASAGPGGTVTKQVFDGLGRSIVTALTDGANIRTAVGATFGAKVAADDASLGNEVVFERSTTTYDHNQGDRGLAYLTSTSRRRHDASGGGIGTSPVTTWSATLYDDAARAVAGVQFGTAIDTSGGDVFAAGGAPPAGLGPSSAASSMPTWSLVSKTRFDAIGRAFETEDPLGRVSRSLFDDAGRTIGSIENYITPSSGSADLSLSWDSALGLWQIVNRKPSTPADQDRVTSQVYDSAGRVVRRIAHLPPDGAVGERRQVTEYVYSPTGALTGNLATYPGPLYAIHYPDAATGLPGQAAQDTVQFAYNIAGEQIKSKDQNGTVRLFERDNWGRLLDDRVSTYGNADIDSTLNSIRTVYDEAGRTTRAVSEYLDLSTGALINTRNEIAYTFDARGRLRRILHAPLGAVTSLVDDAVEYQYDDKAFAAGNFWRLDKVLYPFNASTPGQRTAERLDYSGLSGVDSRISRVTGFSREMQSPASGATAYGVQHDYLGLSRRVRSSFNSVVSGAVTTTFRRDRQLDPSADAGTGRYAGLDRFGRVRHHLWYAGASWSPATQPPLTDIAYGYDKLSNIVSRDEARAGGGFTEACGHDRLNRLTASVHRTDTQTTAPGLYSQTWSLDTMGNWKSVSSATDATHTYSASEEREHNAINEITQAGSSGAAKPFTYDANGNLTIQQLPNTAGGTQVRRVYVYDAWNRLVEAKVQHLVGGSGWTDHQTLARWSYYAGNQRATRVGDAMSGGQLVPDGVPDQRSHYYYDKDWHLLEERIEEHTARPADSDNDDPGDPQFGESTFWNAAITASKQTVIQYLWDPTQWDELALLQHTAAPGSANVNQIAWVRTDRNHTVSDVVPIAGGGTDLLRYTSFGRPRMGVRGDFNADGACNTLDLTAFLASFGKSFGQSGYNPATDMNADGACNTLDLTAFLPRMGQMDRADLVSTPVALGGWGNGIGYGGSVWEPSGQLWLMRSRWLDPALGRWITRDPAGYVDGMSLYLYVKGNPLVYSDPFGMMAFPGWYQYDRGPWVQYKEGQQVRQTRDVCRRGGFGFGDSEYDHTDDEPVPNALPQDLDENSTGADRSGAIDTTTDLQNGHTQQLQRGADEAANQIGSDIVGVAASPVVGRIVTKAAAKVVGAGADDLIEGAESTAASAASRRSKGSAENPAEDAAESGGGRRTVIGKMKDITPEKIGPGEGTLISRMPDKGNPKLNWQQNSGVLREQMNKGLPIRDASVDAKGNLTNHSGFLKAERGLLREHGWTYNPRTQLWNPPPSQK